MNPAPPVGSLADRFRSHLVECGAPRAGESVVVALSGGIDSVVLLHLLRFTAGLPDTPLSAAHFDHGWREGSREDALWVRGLCAAWGIPLHLGRAEDPEGVRGETRARTARYRYLQDVRRRTGARWLLTAHQADDQAETVLFRAFRGTGIRGLQGIPTFREPGLFRPLLPFAREELQAYAASQGLQHREDPDNRAGSGARSVLRRDVLPLVERQVAPGARKALVRLSRLARRWEEGWESLIPTLLDGVVEDRTEEGLLIARDRLVAYHSAVVEALLRAMAEELGVRLDAAGTRRALTFTNAGASGSRIDMPGGLALSREFDRLLLSRAPEPGGERVLELEGPEPGYGSLECGGRRWNAWWGAHPSGHPRWEHLFPSRLLRFPLLLRGRQPGDRVRLSYGSKKVKKLLWEARVPRSLRDRLPILVDRENRVLWLPGLVWDRRMETPAGEETFFLGIGDDDHL